MPTLVLYPFRFRDSLIGKWVRARHKLQVPQIQRHYSEWEITGGPEVRHVTETTTQPFNPFESAGARYDCSNAAVEPMMRRSPGAS